MKHWIAVASAEHVRRGRAGGFMQVCHGKAAPLRRMKPGDGVVYYSPAETFRGSDRLRAFTAIGRVGDSEPYTCDMGGGFIPFRRDVTWMSGAETPIEPLLPILDLSTDRRNWGYQLRFGLVEISTRDFHLIEAAMVRPGGSARDLHLANHHGT
jgi:hypothetical protein